MNMNNPESSAAPSVPRDQHVFGNNTPDERQSMNPLLVPSKFRPTYRPLTAEEKAIHDNIKAAAVALETFIMLTPASRERALAMTKLEESIMWAVKGLTA